MKNQKVLLAILDGWGLGKTASADAIAQANTPCMDALLQTYPHSTLVTFGEDVGLPDGQMGNSEVGHLNIGAGRVVYQELARINKAVRERTLHQNQVLIAALQNAKKSGAAVHLIGLVSDGGVHSHINHLLALCDITQEQGLERVFIHAFTDGRDCDPKSGYSFLKILLQHIENQHIKLASVVGRYYAMDRDKRWERVRLAYDLLVKGVGKITENVLETIAADYENGETDEFLKPILVEKSGCIKDGDTVICFNFRTDRPREITEVLTQKDFPEYDMKKLDLNYVTMTRYDETYRNVEVMFTKDDLHQTLGEILSKAGRTQVRIAETEKYPHVTFFFSGGREQPFVGERRIMVPSAKVATYDLQPEMSAKIITDEIITDIQLHQPDFICLNYANTDMVGHTGIFAAAVQAAETVDGCLERLLDAALDEEYEIFVIADHGNSDFMINEDGTPNTAHTKNLVPCIFISKNNTNVTLLNGRLADVAPTILSRMNVKIPLEMDGNNLIVAH